MAANIRLLDGSSNFGVLTSTCTLASSWMWRSSYGELSGFLVSQIYLIIQFRKNLGDEDIEMKELLIRFHDEGYRPLYPRIGDICCLHVAATRERLSSWSGDGEGALLRRLPGRRSVGAQYRDIEDFFMTLRRGLLVVPFSVCYYLFRNSEVKRFAVEQGRS